MDADRFDALARTLDDGSRRHFLGLLSGFILGAFAPLVGPTDTAAKKSKKGKGKGKGKKKPKSKPRPEPSPPPPGDVCAAGVGGEACVSPCFFGCLAADGTCLRADSNQQSDGVCGLLGERCADCATKSPSLPRCCAGECRECCGSEHCANSASGQACCWGLCGECFTDADCVDQPGRPHCLGFPECACAECALDKHCPSGNICHPTSHSCEPGCNVDDDCDADPTRPHCCNLECVECCEDDHCTGHPNGPQCHSNRTCGCIRIADEFDESCCPAEAICGQTCCLWPAPGGQTQPGNCCAGVCYSPTHHDHCGPDRHACDDGYVCCGLDGACCDIPCDTSGVNFGTVARGRGSKTCAGGCDQIPGCKSDSELPDICGVGACPEWPPE